MLRSEERKDLQIQASQYYTMLQKVKPKLLTQDQFCCGFAMKQGDRPAAADGAAGRAAAGKAAAVAEAPATATTVKDEPSADVTKVSIGCCGRALELCCVHRAFLACTFIERPALLLPPPWPLSR